MSKSKAARLLGDLFMIPLCAGQVCATEAEVGQQLKPVVDELPAAARQQPANIDETSMGRRRWLWVMVTAVATVYQIASGRNRAALRADAVAENESWSQERSGFGILGVYLVGGGDVPSTGSWCLGFPDGLHGRSS